MGVTRSEEPVDDWESVDYASIDSMSSSTHDGLSTTANSHDSRASSSLAPSRSAGSRSLLSSSSRMEGKVVTTGVPESSWGPTSDNTNSGRGPTSEENSRLWDRANQGNNFIVGGSLGGSSGTPPPSALAPSLTILRRPQQQHSFSSSSSSSSLDSLNKDEGPNSKRTIQERTREYQAARNRIFGAEASTEDEDEDNDDTADEERTRSLGKASPTGLGNNKRIRSSPQRSNSRNQQRSPNIERNESPPSSSTTNHVIRAPMGPSGDGSKGFKGFKGKGPSSPASFTPGPEMAHTPVASGRGDKGPVVPSQGAQVDVGG